VSAAHLRFRVGDFVLERTGATVDAEVRPCRVVAAGAGRVQTDAGRWFDDLTGRWYGQGVYRAIHSVRFAKATARASAEE
jgi:hypothetical protein